MNKALKATALALALISFGSTAAWAKGGSSSGGGRSSSSASSSRSAPSYSRPAMPARRATPEPARSSSSSSSSSSSAHSETSSSGSSWFNSWPLFGGSSHRSSESIYCPDGRLKDRTKPKGWECYR